MRAWATIKPGDRLRLKQWRKSVTFDEIRAIVMNFPETEEGTSHGTPAFRVRKKLFCRLWEDGEVLVVKTESGLVDALITSNPEIYFTTPHYQGYDYVLVCIGLAQSDDLAALLADAWSLAAPKKLRDAMA